LRLPGEATVADRVAVPAILLIIVGVLNLLLPILLILPGVRLALMSVEQAEELRAQIIQVYAERGIDTSQIEHMTGADLKRLGTTVYLGWGSIAFLGGLLVTLGGIRMRQMRSYGLSILGSVVAAVPCVSCNGCCLVGQIVGIWALVVLLDANVKAAFR
jgi:hypothetical protein